MPPSRTDVLQPWMSVQRVTVDLQQPKKVQIHSPPVPTPSSDLKTTRSDGETTDRPNDDNAVKIRLRAVKLSRLHFISAEYFLFASWSPKDFVVEIKTLPLLAVHRALITHCGCQ